MFMGDVLYVYTYLRLEAMGEDVRLKVPCGKCKSHFDFIGDPEDTRRARGGDRGGTSRRASRSRADWRWPVPSARCSSSPRSAGASSRTSDLANVGAARLNTFQNAIVGVEGIDPFPGVPDQILENMTKRDVEGLAKHIESVNPAPALAVEAQCPKCKSKWIGPIDWGYDSFFGPSSL
jgi:hypothetical protein